MIRRFSPLADAVLAYLDYHTNSRDAEVWVEGYENGREHGYCVRLYLPGNMHSNIMHRKVLFAENRNSDHIVVYCADSFQQVGHGNSCTDDLRYNHCHFMDYDEASKAAEFIINFLLTGKESGTDMVSVLDYIQNKKAETV